MPMKKVLVINANPKANSLCQSLADQYALVAADNHSVEQINIGDLHFEISLNEGYDKVTDLEPDLVDFQKKILDSEHIVIVSPVWWGTIPAKLKGAIDRAFLPGFSFKYVTGKTMQEKLLKGRTSELIITMDSPPFWYKYIQGNAIYKQLKQAILDFSGIKNISSTYFGPVIHSDRHKRQAWLKKVAELARRVR
ncbi:NAD(P)H-dependent oxidoreductase [Celerinatantimonas diazotrophica]|uniref:Putative NADPH-quinone reductase n=1 Tax=Celerinatantimonas diazotrophica TaxID=412034 RepID=A0A4R1JLA6_9GAMM|nr:NAD(P)H-dependent oxidoreductase [Celerinatantimonas diazotrophica]TCK51832.1 putative NADPH-quinone reductase [Celerinatantimonas diazotrophica]CAG9296476.1 FMN-dependent NADH-azoreductase [Celerinatantimonas diazotrophica]